MRLYPESTEETHLARNLLKQWTDDGYLTSEQYDRLQQDTVSDLRTTNVFLRLVLFVFTIVGVAAAIGLFFLLFLSQPSQQTPGIAFLIFAALCYAAAEVIVAEAHLYRFGIEEALAVCSVALFCIGLEALFLRADPYAANVIQLLVAAAGALSSLWIWYRFGLWYAFPAAMIFALFLPVYWTPSHAVQHVFVAGLYAVGLISIATIGSRHRLDYLRDAYSLAEAFLWLGIYLLLNLKLSAVTLSMQWWRDTQTSSDFATPFYWTTWVLIWCLPPLVVTRGVRQKDRFILAVGAIVTLFTLITNKPYLGWQRHTWDPMLLGIALTAVAVLLRRWLAQGPDGVRHGFTAGSLSARDKKVMNLGSTALGLLTPHSITPAPQASSPDSGFGGASGGGGASGDF